jgi:hypothetical protein
MTRDDVGAALPRRGLSKVVRFVLTIVIATGLGTLIPGAMLFLIIAAMMATGRSDKESTEHVGKRRAAGLALRNPSR